MHMICKHIIAYIFKRAWNKFLLRSEMASSISI